MRYLLLMVLFAGITFYSAPVFASKCYGDAECHACHTCGYCKNCNMIGQTHFCGVYLKEHPQPVKEPATPLKPHRRKKAA